MATSRYFIFPSLPQDVQVVVKFEIAVLFIPFTENVIVALQIVLVSDRFVNEFCICYEVFRVKCHHFSNTCALFK